MSLAFDEFGRPYIIVREQEKKRRVKGLEATRSNLLSAMAVAATLRTSLGPKGMDKMIVSPDGEILITNDGATIVEKMEIAHPIARLMVELSQSQDSEIGDGTTGVVVLAGLLMEQAVRLLDKGVHPLKIAAGFENAVDALLPHLDGLALAPGDRRATLLRAAMTALGSKVVSAHKEHLAEVCVEAVLRVADEARADVNFDLIKIVGKTGQSLAQTELVNGLIVEKDFSHPQMGKSVKDAKIAIVTCPFEPPKPKTKYNLHVASAADYRALHAQEQQYFVEMVRRVKESGADIVMCQWGFDDEANYLLYQSGLRAVRWVSGTDIELLALATGARIVPRFEELHPQKLGFAGLVEELSFGTQQTSMLVVKELSATKAVTILVRGGSKTIVDEAHRSIHDALCVVRNLYKDPRVVLGGGSAELSCALKLRALAEETPTVEQYVMRAMADALEQVCVVLAENSGMDPIQAMSEARARQLADGSAAWGIACMEARVDDMRRHEVYETLSSKRHQLQLAAQVVKMVLKIDDLVERNE